MTRLTTILLVGVAALATSSGGVDGAPIDEAVSVVIEPTDSAVVLGESLSISVTVTNDGDDPTAPLVAHIDITDPGQDNSVDPEDWTSTLSKSVGVLDAGESRAVAWDMQPISGGTFTVYAVALADGDDGLAVSNAMIVTVDDRRSLDPGGILPIAIGMPTFIGALLLVRVRSTHRSRRSRSVRVVGLTTPG